MESDTNPFRYCGEYYDKETGTIYLRARSYDPSIGRFISRDSFAGKIEDPLSLNLYTYCANNPIVNVDPNGHFWHIVAGAAVGAVISGGIQVVSNVISGEDWHEGLGTALLAGAASGALASTGIGLAGQIVGNAAISMTVNTSSQLNEMSENSSKKFSVKSLAIDGVIGAVTGLVGGKGPGGKNYEKLGKQIIKRTKNKYKFTGGNVSQTLKEARKATSYYWKNIRGAYAKNLKKGFKASSIVSTTWSWGNSTYNRMKEEF